MGRFQLDRVCTKHVIYLPKMFYSLEYNLKVNSVVAVMLTNKILQQLCGCIADTRPLCLGCHGPVKRRLCSRCSWPVCSEDCEAAPLHAGECTVFSTARARFQPLNDWNASTPQLDCITPLRYTEACIGFQT
jgi:hypothetical protein